MGGNGTIARRAKRLKMQEQKYMEINVICRLEELLVYRKEWEAILDKNNNDVVFIEFDWIVNWWRFLGDGHELYILALKHKGDICGFCPLMMTRKKGYRELNFIGYKEASYMDFVLSDQWRKQCIEAIVKHLKGLRGTVVNLRGFFEDSTNMSFLKMYLRQNNICFGISCIPCFFIPIHGKAFDVYYKSRFSNHSRSTMRRKENRMKKLGRYRYRKCIPSELDKAFEVYDKRWLRKVGNSRFSEGKAKAFFKHLVLNDYSTFQVETNVIEIGGKIIAFSYGFVCRGRFTGYRIAHDDDFYMLSPGELVMKERIKQCFDTGIRVFDFGAGYEFYKTKWTDSSKMVVTVLFPTNCFIPKLVCFKHSAVKQIKEVLKKNGVIYYLRKHVLGKIKYYLSGYFLKHVFRQTKIEFKRKGFLKWINTGFRRVIQPLYVNEEYNVFVKSLNSAYLKAGRKRFSVREVGIDELDNLADITNQKASHIVRKLYWKHKCLLVQDDKKVVCYLWINEKEIELPMINYTIKINSNHTAHLYDCCAVRGYCDEDTAEQILDAVLDWLYQNQYSGCYVAVNNKDISAIHRVFIKRFEWKCGIRMQKVLGKTRYHIFGQTDQ